MLYNPKWKTSYILNLAADLIEKHGHAKQTLEDDDGRLCMGGAILKASTGNARLTSSPYCDEVFKWMNEQVGGSLVTWNNAPERTKEEVVAVLRKAANETA